MGSGHRSLTASGNALPFSLKDPAFVIATFGNSIGRLESSFLVFKT